jgi:hypothetical protein
LATLDRTVVESAFNARGVWRTFVLAPAAASPAKRMPSPRSSR